MSQRVNALRLMPHMNRYNLECTMGPRSLQRYVELRVDAVSALALMTLNREHGLQTYAYLVVSGSWTCDVYRKSTECRRKAGLVVRVVFFDQTTQRTSKHAMQPTLSANACTTRAEPPRCGKRRKGHKWHRSIASGSTELRHAENTCVARSN